MKKKRIYLWILTLAFLCSGCTSSENEIQSSENPQEIINDTESLDSESSQFMEKPNINSEGLQFIDKTATNLENSQSTDETATNPKNSQFIDEASTNPTDSQFIDETATNLKNSQSTENNLKVSQTTENEETATNNGPEPSDTDLVLIKKYIPDIYIDLKYATTDNFTGVVIYENDDACLRYGTLKKLMQVQENLKQMGYSLLIWDAYRPVEAQFKLWEICPDANYVSNPHKGFSKHSRGNTVDITLVTVDGKPVEMPTGFDDFSALADRDYSDVSQTAGQNSQMLEDIMEAAGFSGYRGEWWHYSDNTEYPVVQ